MANPKTLIELLGYLKGSGTKADRLRAMAKARQRFSMVGRDPETGLAKVLGHRQDILTPELSEALRQRAEYARNRSHGLSDPEEVWLQNSPRSLPEIWEDDLQMNALEARLHAEATMGMDTEQPLPQSRRGKPPWWRMAVAKGEINPLDLEVADFWPMEHRINAFDSPLTYEEEANRALELFGSGSTSRELMTDRALDVASAQDEAARWVKAKISDPDYVDPGVGGVFRTGVAGGPKLRLVEHGAVSPREHMGNVGRTHYTPGHPIYRHETLHGLLNAMTPEEAKTMPLPFRIAHWAHPRHGGFTRDWRARALDELQAWGGMHRNDPGEGLSRFLKAGPPEHNKRYVDPLLVKYLGEEYDKPELAEIYRLMTTDHPDGISFREELKSRAGMGAAAAGAAGYSLYNLNKE